MALVREKHTIKQCKHASLAACDNLPAPWHELVQQSEPQRRRRALQAPAARRRTLRQLIGAGGTLGTFAVIVPYLLVKAYAASRASHAGFMDCGRRGRKKSELAAGQPSSPCAHKWTAAGRQGSLESHAETRDSPSNLSRRQ